MPHTGCDAVRRWSPEPCRVIDITAPSAPTSYRSFNLIRRTPLPSSPQNIRRAPSLLLQYSQAISDHAQYPTLNVGYLALVRLQRRGEVCLKRTIPVCPFNPRRRRVCRVAVTVPVIAWESLHPQRRVHLCNDGCALRNSPAVERPEVNLSLAMLSEISQPLESGVRGLCYRALYIELEHRLRRRCPTFRQSKPLRIACSESTPTADTIPYKVYVGVDVVGRPSSPVGQPAKRAAPARAESKARRMRPGQRFA
jgi:hypothetical protein